MQPDAGLTALRNVLALPDPFCQTVRVMRLPAGGSLETEKTPVRDKARINPTTKILRPRNGVKNNWATPGYFVAENERDGGSATLLS